MKESEKAEILKKIGEALDRVEYGKITIELRGPNRPVDVVEEKRNRIEIKKENKC